jgi:hypothetical protein
MNSMPWIPKSEESLFLKNQIKRRFSDAKNDVSAGQVLTVLLQASGKKQASAVADYCTTFDQVRLLRDYGFANIKDNSTTAIQAALDAAATALAAAKAAAQKQTLLNQKLEGYLSSINGKYKNHMKGFAVNVPIVDTVGVSNTTVAAHYNNGEGKLPGGGNYIEWYPLVGGTRSAHKRFFTQQSSSIIWYTEGGTHGATLEWFRRDKSDRDWIKF